MVNGRYLKRLEMVYRSFYPHDLKDTSMGLPYWDSTLDGNLPSPEESIMFSDYVLALTHSLHILIFI
jgi:hypothetical protein